MMSHINKGDVHAFLDGALGAYPEEEAGHVRRHLDECPECARLLEDERRLRDEASRILAGSAVRPFEHDPLGELQARAATLDGQVGAQQVEGAGRAEGSGQKGTARPTLVSRMYSLRWAATVVVSLGAGWMARGLNGPDLNGERGSLTEPVATESSAPVARELDTRASANQELQESNERDDAGRLAEAETLPESPAAVVGGALGSDSGRGAGGFDADAVLDQDDAARDQVGAALDRADAAPDRQRAASSVARGVGPADANVGGQPAEPRLEVLSLSDELRDPAPAAALQDGASLFNDDAPASSADASLATTALMVPGLPVRDVRVAPNAGGLAGGPTEGLRGIVIVTQALADGRLIELEFVPVAENDSVGLRTFQERREPQDRTRRAGWSVVVRDVPGGVAFLSGPLSEPELAELLDRALGLR